MTTIKKKLKAAALGAGIAIASAVGPTFREADAPSKTVNLALYTPHEMQLKGHECPARFRVAAWGRQSGKSTWALNELTKRAWTGPRDGIYWFVSPTYKGAKVQFRRMLKMFRSARGAIKSANKSELRVTLINGADIFFVSGHNYEDLRGETLNGCIIDEVRQQNAKLWPLVIRPMLSTTRGWCIFVSTPNGFDHFYDLAQKAKSGRKNWEFFHAPSTCNPLFTKEEFEAAKADMSEAQFAQEVLAEFRNLTAGLAYKTYGRHNLVQVNPFTKDGEKWSKYMPIHVFMDFNVGLMGWTLAQFKEAHGIYVGEEIAIENTHTQECANELIQRVKGHKAGIVIIGDAAGKSTNTKGAGQTDYDILAEMLAKAKIPFRIETPDSNPLVKDRVNTVNARLMSADKTVRVWINEAGCPKLIKDMERVTWKEGAIGTLDKKTDESLTHLSDGFGYGVCVLMPLEGVREVGTLVHVGRV